MNRPRNAMTVDLEDYFQVSAFESQVPASTWETRECRIERNAHLILALFARHGVKATFFSLGWIAERFPKLMREICSAGHEVASHGYRHVRVTEQTPEQFRQDVRSTKQLLEDTCGCSVRGYRAASFSITKSNQWALDVLAEEGYAYSSSIYPIRHDHYGIPDAPRFVFRPGHRDLLEVPVTTVSFMNRNLPCGGGGYFRLVPYALSRWALRRVNRREGESAVFYFHPWEVDPDQPVQQNIGLKTHFRHYVNLSRMAHKLDRLLGDFEWGRMDEVFLLGTHPSSPLR
jgi:polysaccharide deacetylase family protein (PEP-CTERM system associated)